MHASYIVHYHKHPEQHLCQLFCASPEEHPTFSDLKKVPHCSSVSDWSTTNHLEDWGHSSLWNRWIQWNWQFCHSNNNHPSASDRQHHSYMHWGGTDTTIWEWHFYCDSFSWRFVPTLFTSTMCLTQLEVLLVGRGNGCRVANHSDMHTIHMHC